MELKEKQLLNKIIRHGFTKDAMLEIQYADAKTRHSLFKKLDAVHKRKYAKLKEELKGKRKGGF